ncbi:MAG: hypothetical protein NVV72_14670 [Asticcacaulis sp.]|nr:hypothetical protein [Asticcacaulis sp.]
MKKHTSLRDAYSDGYEAVEAYFVDRIGAYTRRIEEADLRIEALNTQLQNLNITQAAIALATISQANQGGRDAAN